MSDNKKRAYEQQKRWYEHPEERKGGVACQQCFYVETPENQEHVRMFHTSYPDSVMLLTFCRGSCKDLYLQDRPTVNECK